MSASKPVVSGTLLLLGALAQGADDKTPDEDFLEYLGSWEESDEDWLMFEDQARTEDEERTDPAPDGEESTENEDES